MMGIRDWPIVMICVVLCILNLVKSQASLTAVYVTVGRYASVRDVVFANRGAVAASLISKLS